MANTKIAVKKPALKKQTSKKVESTSEKTPTKKVIALPKEVVKGTNGKMYTVTLGSNKVQSIKVFSELEKVLQGSKRDASNFMDSLHKYLREKDETTVKKKDFITCRGYKMYFDDEGFSIRDTLNFNKPCELWDIPFPTPLEVWQFISTPKFTKHETKVKEEPIIKTIAKTKKVSAVKDEIVPKVVEVVKPTEPTLLELEEFRKKCLRILQRNTNPYVTIEKLRDFIPHRSWRIFFNKIAKRYEEHSIRAKAFFSEVIIMTKEISFEPRLEPAPKFLGLTWWGISALVIDQDVITFSVVDVENKKEVMHQMNKGEFVGRYLLHKYPEMMEQTMKFCRKEITFEQFTTEYIVRDKYCHFNLRDLQTCGEPLYEACTEILYDLEELNPLDIAYANELPHIKKNMDVKVRFFETYSEYRGVVAHTLNGINVRYKDGSVSPILKHQINHIKIITDAKK